MPPWPRPRWGQERGRSPRRWRPCDGLVACFVLTARGSGQQAREPGAKRGPNQFRAPQVGLRAPTYGAQERGIRGRQGHSVARGPGLNPAVLLPRGRDAPSAARSGPAPQARGRHPQVRGRLCCPLPGSRSWAPAVTSWGHQKRGRRPGAPARPAWSSRSG